VWFTHPANASREARRLPTVNAFWPWSGTTTTGPKTVVPAQGSAPPRGTPVPQPEPGTLQSISTFETEGWLTALATRKLSSLAEITNTLAGDTLLICGNVATPAISADWHGWLQQMQRLESDLFAPTLSALMRGEVKQVRLVLTHRTAHAEFTTTALAQRKFWRRPTLDRLI
jgi:hypothetical protein